MRHPFILTAAAAASLAALSQGALAQAPNPLGVEWVGGSATPSPQTAQPAGPTGGGGTASNPLGVDWVGGGAGSSAPAPHAGAQPGNPLGVDWVGGQPSPPPPQVPTGGFEQPAPALPPPAPTPPPPAQPTPPPLAPPAPALPDPSPPPATDTGRPGLAAALADTWIFRAVAFTDGRGTVSEVLGVEGALRLRPDGTFEQALYIGGVPNLTKGTYRVVGDRLETTYVWRVEVTDVFDIHLDATGKMLTLAGRGTPKSHYTLERAE